MTTMTEIVEGIDAKKYTILSMVQTSKKTTAIVFLSNGLQKEIAYMSAKTLQGFYGVYVQDVKD